MSFCLKFEKVKKKFNFSVLLEGFSLDYKKGNSNKYKIVLKFKY